MDLETLSVEQLPELSHFLAEVFRVPLEAAFLTPKMLQWKYYYPREDWQTPRNFVLRQGGRIVAHAGLWPVSVERPHGVSRGAHLIDWAGHPKAPGVGVLLLRMLLEHCDFLLTIGGSEATRAILPRIGYRLCGHEVAYARPLRPWRAVRNSLPSHWRGWARIARNLYWSMAPVPPLPRHWTVVEGQRGDSMIERTLTEVRASVPAPVRSRAAIEQMLVCPDASARFFQLRTDGHPRGYFVLSEVQGQVRLADLRVSGEDASVWRSALAVATRTALANPAAKELAADAALPLLRRALETTGFRSRYRLPVFLLDPKETLGREPSLYLQMLDGDAAYLITPGAMTRT